MVKKIFLLACLFSLLFTVPAIAASSKAKLLTDTSSSANTVPFINAGPAEDSTAATGLGIQVNGTERMRVTATGSVGIGTTTPAAALDVVSTSTPYGTEFKVGSGVVTLLQSSTSAVFPYIEWRDKTGTRGAYMGWGGATEFDLALENGRNLAITGGNVGIGTVSPGQKLSVAGTIESTSGGVKFPDGTTQTSAIPSGMIAAFATTACPTGWSEYTAARGAFLRGIDNGAGRDPSGTRSPGDYQADMVGPHTHPLGNNYIRGGGGEAANLTLGGGGYVYNWSDSTASNGTAETRPENVAVTFCQKN